MDKKKTVQDINKNICEAREAIKTLSREAIIELRAELEGSKVYFDKWVSFMAYFAGMIAILALKTDWVDNHLVAILMIINALSMIIQCIVGYRNAQKVKALSILNDIVEENKSIQNIETSDDIVIENYECLIQKQLKERERILIEWKNKQNYVNEQVALFEASLSYNEKK